MAGIKDKEEFSTNQLPSIFWKKFFDRFQEIETKQIPEWGLVHLIGYFCKLYKNHYNMDYTFKFNASPSKCYEVFQLKKVASMISSDPVILKDYIDWVFRVKVLERKKRISVIGYLASLEMINEFKFKHMSGNTQAVIDRATALNDQYILLAKEEGVDISTYGELAFIKSMLSSDLDIDTMTKYNNIFLKLSNNGFDKSILDRIM